MEREYRVGQHVIYVDGYGNRRDALVKTWWVQWPPGGYPSAAGARHPDIPSDVIVFHKSNNGDGAEPGCNLVFVSGDPKRDDSCGRQTEVSTSVVHKGQQVAHGNYWCWPDE